MSEQKTVVIMATLDTKGEEAAFVRDEITASGLDTILIDPGILGNPSVAADITRYDVAKAAGTALEILVAQGKKGDAIAKQTEGLCRIVKDLYATGRLDGIIGLGGGQGTSIGTAAMRLLPLGVPKLMVSTIASGTFQFGPYVGTKDICVMYSVTDILGLNTFSRPILRNAANAIAGMVLRHQVEQQVGKPAIAITMLGMTTSCVMRVKKKVEEQGYEVVPFHASGTGGPAMEESIEAGRFVGVIDLNTHEMMDDLHGGLGRAPGRLEALTRFRIPAVVSVGGNDFILFETLEKAPAKYQGGRRTMVHNAQMTIVQPTPEEMRESARVMADRLNRALGPTLVLLPLRGFTDPNREGREMWGPEGNQAMIDELRMRLRPEVPTVLVDAHINDPQFAEVIADCMVDLVKGKSPKDIAARYYSAIERK
ncbi:MAG: Tm-1-like ATP-binding domain-containing protein [Ardenticatenaceae bacterium]|nr:Tm-1-like ATP-binding domain-containing protein [Ardenticatenaceae bacterium]